MYTKWTSHLPSEEQASFRREILGSRFVLERLKNIIQEKQDEIDKIERAPKTFDQGNWAYKQAYYNGYHAAMDELKKIVDLDHQQIPLDPR